MMTVKKWIFVLGSLFFSAWAMSATPTLEQVYSQYLAAVDGKQSADSVYEQLKDFPSNPEVSVIKGSTLTLMGRDAWLPWTKMKYAENGIVLIERCVRDLTEADHKNEFGGVPVDIFVKFIAGSTYRDLPELFHKKAEGKALLDEVANNQALQRLKQK